MFGRSTLAADGWTVLVQGRHGAGRLGEWLLGAVACSMLGGGLARARFIPVPKRNRVAGRRLDQEAAAARAIFAQK
jgi:hypothetical protein